MTGFNDFDILHIMRLIEEIDDAEKNDKRIVKDEFARFLARGKLETPEKIRALNTYLTRRLARIQATN